MFFVSFYLFPGYTIRPYNIIVITARQQVLFGALFSRVSSLLLVTIEINIIRI